MSPDPSGGDIIKNVLVSECINTLESDVFTFWCLSVVPSHTLESDVFTFWCLFVIPSQCYVKRQTLGVRR